MNNKKKLMVAGASTLGIAAIGLGAYAYFFDSATDTETATVGTVDMTGSSAIAHQDIYGQEIDNLNPGDNDPENPVDSRDGVDHELTVNYANTGNKSIITRTVLTVTGVDKDGNALSNGDLANVLISMNNKKDAEAVDANGIPNLFIKADALGDTALRGNRPQLKLVANAAYVGANNAAYIVADTDKITVNGNAADTSLVYVIGGTEEAPFILSGVEAGNAAVETEYYMSGDTKIAYPTSGSLTFDIGLDKDVMDGVINNMINAESNRVSTYTSPLLGATITIRVDVQAMQYKNTQSSDWESIFSDSYALDVLADSGATTPEF